MIAPRLMGIVVALAFWVSVTGCTQQQPEASRSAPRSAVTEPVQTASSGSPAELKVKSFTATVKGRVTYNGAAPPKVQMYVTPEDLRKWCPAEIPTRGWYCAGSTDGKGVRYAVVFLKPAAGWKMPKLPENYKPPAGQEVVTIEMRDCQYQPRVTVLGPKQDLRFQNSEKSLHNHSAKLIGRQIHPELEKVVPPGLSFSFKDQEVHPCDAEPYIVACRRFSAFMQAYVWKFRHPWAAVTDADGRFQISHCPVPINGKLELWVWQEELETRENRKPVRVLELKDAGTTEVSFSIPR
jgi:hypothetical protein